MSHVERVKKSSTFSTSCGEFNKILKEIHFEWHQMAKNEMKAKSEKQKQKPNVKNHFETNFFQLNNSLRFSS